MVRALGWIDAETANITPSSVTQRVMDLRSSPVPVLRLLNSVFGRYERQEGRIC